MFELNCSINSNGHLQDCATIAFSVVRSRLTNHEAYLVAFSSSFFLGRIFPRTTFSKSIFCFLPIMSTISNTDSTDKPFELSEFDIT